MKKITVDMIKNAPAPAIADFYYIIYRETDEGLVYIAKTEYKKTAYKTAYFHKGKILVGNKVKN